MHNITILIMDNHTLVRTGIIRILEDVDNFSVIAEAENGEEALSLIKKLKPDMVIMNIKASIGNDLEVIQKMLQMHPDIKILILAA
jgi:two-component system, NarL family, invasion response regulator UvrY